ncbi:MAG TPA: hypothetical protein VGJ30_07440 [Candidatus Angelobacter sp.]
MSFYLTHHTSSPQSSFANRHQRHYFTTDPFTQRVALVSSSAYSYSKIKTKRGYT